MKRAKVKFITDGRDKEWRIGEVGYIDSYIKGDNGAIYPVIIKESGDIVFGFWCSFKVINFNELGE